MALDNFMKLVHKEVHVSEMKTEELHSWHHVCAEALEKPTCGKVMERRRTRTGSPTLLGVLKNR